MSNFEPHTSGEIEISYSKKSDGKIIKYAFNAADFFQSIWDQKTMELQESFCVLYLNRKNEVIAWHFPFKGGTAATVIDFKIILATAVKVLASGLIVAHNHPSGNLKPSTNDIKMSKNLAEALKLVEMDLMDSMIITKNSYYSLRENNEL